jgi:glucose-1-phosphate thymidylyltransferase
VKKPLKIVIPMAGFGTRLRPLTWSKPKPLVSLAGKTVFDHVLNMFRTVPNFDAVEFVFILGPNMGDQIKEHVAINYPDWHVDYAVQPEMKGQSDAFWQAKEFLHGPMLMSFSDTLIENDFSFLKGGENKAFAWVKPVDDPRRFGVADVDGAGSVQGLIEKPEDMSNNLAVVGCYYFPEAEALIDAIETQIERDIALKQEYYLADAINIMIERGLDMRVQKVDVWLDAGTPEALFKTNRYLLDHGRGNSAQLGHYKQTVIIPPVNIDPSAEVSNSIIGPYVSIGKKALVEGSIIKESIIGPETQISDSLLEISLIGQGVNIKGQTGKLNLGDESWAIR